ncbi:MAG: hypothetical protein HY976_01820 [Candidatus Kerfeldbacteria bacterium]|nr:hypothetical protein [Candidatus Kerfeldbacteria bacterium]
MSRPGQMHLNDQRGISQGVGLIAVLAVGLVGLSLVYLMARQEVYAESGNIDFTKIPKTNQSVNAPTNAN